MTSHHAELGRGSLPPTGSRELVRAGLNTPRIGLVGVSRMSTTVKHPHCRTGHDGSGWAPGPGCLFLSPCTSPDAQPKGAEKRLGSLLYVGDSPFRNPFPVRVSLCEFSKSSQPPSEVGAIFRTHFTDEENQGSERLNILLGAISLVSRRART